MATTKFSTELTEKMKDYFKRKFDKDLDDEETQRYLQQLADLGNLFLKNADKLLKEK